MLTRCQKIIPNLSELPADGKCVHEKNKAFGMDIWLTEGINPQKERLTNRC
jgi:hypothetical protein